MASVLRPSILATQVAAVIAVFSVPLSSASSSPSASLDLTNPLLGEDTIGYFMLKNPPQNFTDAFVKQTPNCTGLVDNVDASTLDSSAWSCASSAILVPRRRRLPNRFPFFNTYSYSATYDDGNGNGYNITYPTQLCSYNVIGDVLSPDGYLVQNATLQSVYTSLNGLSPEALYEYTTTMLQGAVNRFEHEFEAILCESPVGGARGLLTRYQASQVSGSWVLGITGTIGTLGLAFGGLYVPIAHPGPTANFSRTVDVLLAAAASVLLFVLSFALDQMHKKEITNVIEAFIFTLVVTTGEVFLDLLKHAWQNTCTTTLIVLAETGKFFLRIKDRLTIYGDDTNLPPGASVVPQNNPPQGPQPQQQIQLANVCP